ncbi:hypothetical protein BZZ01_10910 [Nostocales cyanobacterium HT-58-2]|nr:hypothetical protein BZZ01_10910 [Nostocales cyanobacterium HT-58-2]
MVLSRWQPLREMNSLQRQMNRLFERLMSTEETDFITDESLFVPVAEIHEAPDHIALRVEIPGVNPDDLDVKVTPEAVLITGERKSEIREEDRGRIRSEFRYGRFQRMIPLPSRVQNDKVEAEFNNGILLLRLPKSEEEQKRIVSVRVGAGAQGQQGQISTGQQEQSTAESVSTSPQDKSQPS